MKAWNKLKALLFHYLGVHVHIAGPLVPPPPIIYPSAATKSCLPIYSYYPKTSKLFFGII